MMKTTIALLLFSGAAAHLGVYDHIVAVPMVQYKKSCGLPSNLSVVPQMVSQMTAFLQGSNIPGAGIEEFTPFKTVHNDGFVPKEDQQPMTQKVCFEFCRTIPNMGFFGIVNGRGCYCTPYFKAMESDSSQCDSGCAGDATVM